ncbi:MAG TPA: carboxymuconolactone decarboxylase family protein [Trueperaceae bacterium]|nr:carboxymuconolactone decarboxylase family protein [Trueperaceae bacterium]
MTGPSAAASPRKDTNAPPMYPAATPELVARRRELAPGIHGAWDEFSAAVFAAGALDEVTKQLIAVAAAHITQCPYCIKGHTRKAILKGATEEQVMEAIWIAAEMRSGGALAHSTIALNTLSGMGDHVHGAGEARV